MIKNEDISLKIVKKKNRYLGKPLNNKKVIYK